MNNLERQMLAILKDLKENYGAIAIKAEFEAEGSRLAELSRLNEIVLRADMDLVIKIGGCEAMRDLFDAEIIGAAGVMAPMIETPFAMSKFISAVDKAYNQETKASKKFIANAETITCYHNFDEILAVPGIEMLDCFIVGRSDLSGSMGVQRQDINGPEMFDITSNFLAKAAAKGIKAGVGGNISTESLNFLEELGDDLYKYETRKVTFKASEALVNAKEGLVKALEFETLYLRNKYNHYNAIANEDLARLTDLEKRMGWN